MRKKVFLIYFITIILLFVFNFNIALADVGSFESYDSGSSSSSWDSGSSWSSSSSSWDDDYDYSYSGGSGTFSFGSIFILLTIFIIFIAVRNQINKRIGSLNITHNNFVPPIVNEAEVEAKIKAVDELFNKEVFLSWAKDLFVKLQEAWTARDWSTIRTFETNELFEQHKKQLQGYIDAKQINVMERICVKSASLSDFKQVGDKDILVINLSSKMVDYIIDENTNKIIKGDKVTDRHSTYKMVFVRKTGLKTQASTGEIRTTNCPNCGAPTEITSSGKCKYCGSVITTDEHDWALSNLEKIM